MDIWPKRDKKSEDRHHEEIIGKLKESKEKHRGWVRHQFPNYEDVVRGAKDVVIEYERDRLIDPGTIEPIFDDHSAHLGYFLIVHGRVEAEHDIVAAIRQRTGETFEVDHVLEA
jgi:hypothetical protein